MWPLYARPAPRAELFLHWRCLARLVYAERCRTASHPFKLAKWQRGGTRRRVAHYSAERDPMSLVHFGGDIQHASHVTVFRSCCGLGLEGDGRGCAKGVGWGSTFTHGL